MLGDLRNDLYLTFHSGEFERGMSCYQLYFVQFHRFHVVVGMGNIYYAGFSIRIEVGGRIVEVGGLLVPQARPPRGARGNF